MEDGILHYLILGFVQGLTEFLPISSSAHLILLPHLFGWQDQGLAMDVAAHVGTLCAVIFYFRNDLKLMLGSWVTSRFSFDEEHSRSLWYLIFATLPIAIAGLLSSEIIENYLRDPLVIAGATLFFGFMIYLADHFGKKTRTVSSLTIKDVLIIGAFQVLALIPGTSRSGITITAGLLLGMNRESAARFAFLLSIPTILLAGGYEGFKLAMSQEVVDWSGMFIVTLVSFGMAVITIHFFIKLLDRTGLLPYVIYRVLLGSLLVYIYI